MKAGFVPGEKIVFNASIDNRSSKTIKSISAILVQTTTLIYNRSRKHKSSRNIVTLRYDGPEIGPRMKENWSNVGLIIPAVCPSLLNTCRIIKLDYTLRLIVNFNGLTIRKMLDIPILIGTVPLYDSKINLPDKYTIAYYRSIVDRNGRVDGKRSIWHKNYREGLNRNPHRSNRKEYIYNFEPRYPYYEDKDFYYNF